LFNLKELRAIVALMMNLGGIFVNAIGLILAAGHAAG